MSPTKSNASTKQSPQEIPFEDALQRLEEVVNAMEDGDLSLDDMMTHFEEGMLKEIFRMPWSVQVSPVLGFWMRL